MGIFKIYANACGLDNRSSVGLTYTHLTWGAMF